MFVQVHFHIPTTLPWPVALFEALGHCILYLKLYTDPQLHLWLISFQNGMIS